MKNLREIFDIETATIKQRTIFLDVDGTIVPDKQTELPSSFIEFIKKLSHDNRVILCSNGSSLPKIRHLVEVECVKSNKPFLKNVISSVKDIKNPLVIGDKYLTDGLFAHFLNADFIKVDHFRSESDKLLIRLTYFLDDQIWKVAPYILSLRPWQWIKNLLVFAPIFFAGTALNLTDLATSALVFVVFCVVSSSIYVWNDIKDIEADRVHPEKNVDPLLQIYSPLNLPICLKRDS